MLEVYKKSGSEKKITDKEFIKVFIDYYIPTNPAVDLFKNERENLVCAYKKNIIEIYEYIIRMKCQSESKFLSDKILELRTILMEIYQYEIRLLIKVYRDELDEIMSIKELEVKTLNWIKHK